MVVGFRWQWPALSQRPPQSGLPLPRFPSPLIEPDVRICRVDQPLLAFTPTDPGVRRYRAGLLGKVTRGRARAPCQD